MAVTLGDIEALENAIKTGALSVQYSDKKVTYRSLDEMQRVLNWMRGKLGQRPITRKTAVIKKGL